MKDYIEQRCVEIAEYILNNKATVRSCAKVFGVSKSTIHKDIAERLIKINPILSKEVKQILEYNKSVRHIRGGLATQEKYKHYEEKAL